MAISATQVSTSYLVVPVSNQGDVGKQLRKDAGMILGGLDGMVEFLFGFSPLTEWVAKPFTGNWDAIACGGQAWENVGKAIAVSASNFHTIPDQIGQRWDGGVTSSAFRKEVNDVADKFAKYQDGCNAMSELCATMVQVSQAASQVIGQILGMIGNIVTRIIVTMAIPIIGQALAAAQTAAAVPRVINWARKVANILDRLYKAAKAFVQGFNKLKAMYEVLKRLLATVKAGMAANAQGASTGARVQTAFA